MQAVIDYYGTLGSSYKDALEDMLVFDAVIGNTDRHLGNFGFLVDAKTNTLTGPAPLFDHGNSMFNFASRMEMESRQAFLDFADAQNFFDLLLVEVGQTDGTDFALLVSLFHQAITGNVITGRLVNEQQVDVVGVQTCQRLVHSIGIGVEAGPQLGFEENFLPLQAGLLHGAAHGFFVAVGVGGVDQAVAVLQGADAGGLCLVRGQKKCANTGHGHFHAVIESCVFHKRFLLKCSFQVSWLRFYWSPCRRRSCHAPYFSF